MQSLIQNAITTVGFRSKLPRYQQRDLRRTPNLRIRTHTDTPCLGIPLHEQAPTESLNEVVPVRIDRQRRRRPILKSGSMLRRLTGTGSATTT